MASALRSGLMLVVLLLASVFFLPWARIVPWRASDIDRRPAIGVMSLQSDRHIDAVDAALIGRDLPPRHLSPDDPADWADEERINAHARDASRAELIDRLTRPGPRACSGMDRAALIDAVQFYYNTRRRQIAVFSRRGPRAAAYVSAAWSTVMDQRIDELVQSVVAEGYLNPLDGPATSAPNLTQALGGIEPAPCPQRG